jgi:AcrR family transcriptional regulator
MVGQATADRGKAANAGKAHPGRRDRRTRSARAEGADPRAALLAAAAELFAERGFSGASVDDIAERAGYSKGALYWHFQSKDELFFALMDQSVDASKRELIRMLHEAPPEQDIAPEASRRLVQLVSEQRDLLLLDREYWAQAVRDPELGRRYAARRQELRAALGRALEVRFEHLGTPALGMAPEEMATVVMALSAGLAEQRLIDARAVPDELLGRAVVLLYRGLLASAGDQPPTSSGRAPSATS